MTAKKLKIGILGTCPVCEGEFKARDGKLVHHGFTRPGDGAIHGDCFAVAYEPYERSTKGCEDYKAATVSALTELREWLKKLSKKTYFMEVKKSWRTNEIETTEYAVGVTDRYTWERLVDSKRSETEHAIKVHVHEVARMDRLIAAWTLKPLREVTEEAAATLLKTERDARKAERDAKNAVKEAKATALKSARAAREAKREAAFVAFIAKLEAVDFWDTTAEEKKRHALATWHEFFSKKTARDLGRLSDFLYEFRKRGLDGLLVRLEVATNHKGYTDYPSLSHLY